MRYFFFVLSFLMAVGVLLLLFNFNPAQSSFATETSSEGNKRNFVDERFNKHWFDGKAEVAEYDLQQARYGEMRKGTATLIFVTEPFSAQKQVKLDNPNAANKVDVLKLNAVRKFQTGVYPYSTMVSVFSPIQADKKLIKITTSIQEWCGHVFMQFNQTKKGYHFSGKSYFESEGDHEYDLASVWFEDALWNLIRINPEALPTGNFEMMPSSLFIRLNHHKAEAVQATAKLNTAQTQEYGENLMCYQIQYEKPEKREIKIYFQKDFPHQIKAWEEGYQDIAWNSDRAMLTTKAILKKASRYDYWNKNKLVHENKTAP